MSQYDQEGSLKGTFGISSASNLDTAMEDAPQALKNYVASLNDAELAETDIATATKEAQKSISTFATITSKAKGVLATFGSTLVSIGISMAASFAISKAFEGIKWIIDEWNGTHQREAAKKSVEQVNEIEKNMKNVETTVGDNKDRYLELYSGVTIDNNHIKNVSLANDEYQEFLDINNKILDVLPSLQTGFDAQGNRIADLGKNAEEAGKKIKEATDYELYRQANEIKENISPQWKQNLDEQEDLEKEIKQLQKQVDDYEDISGLVTGTSDIFNQRKQIVIGQDMEGNEYYERVKAAFQSGLMQKGLEDVQHYINQTTGELVINSISDDEMEILRAHVMNELKDIPGIARDAAQLIPNKQADIKTTWKEYAEGMVTIARQDSSYKQLGAVLGDQFNESFDTALYNMDWYKAYYDAWGEESDAEWEDFVSKNLLEPMLTALNNGDIEKQDLMDFFTLDATGKTNEEFRSQMDGLLDTIYGDNEKTKRVIRLAIGYTYLDENGKEHEYQTARRDRIYENFKDNIPFADIKKLTSEQQEAIISGNKEIPNTIKSLEDLLDWVTQYNNRVAEMDNTKLSEVLGTEDFGKQTKTQVSNLSSLTSAIDEYIESGKIADSTKTNIEELFQSLAEFDTDDATFFKAMLDKRLDYVQEYTNKLYELMDYKNLSKADQKGAQNYIRTFISGSDITGVTEQQAKASLLKMLLKDTKDLASAQIVGNEFDNMMAALGEDADWSIVAQIGADSTLADMTMQDFIDRYKDLKIEAELEVKDRAKESRIAANKSAVQALQVAGVQVGDDVYSGLLTDYEDTKTRAKSRFDKAKENLTNLLNNGGKETDADVVAAFIEYNNALTEYNNAYAEEIEMQKEAVENQVVALNNNIQDQQNQIQQLDHLVTQNQKNRKRTSQDTFNTLQDLSNQEADTYDEIAQSWFDAAEGTTIPALKSFFQTQGLTAQENATEARNKADEYGYGINTENLAYLGDELTNLKADAQEINDLITLKQAKGLKITEKEYKDLANISKRQIQNLKAQNKELEDAKNKTSDYKKQMDLQSQIDANNSAITSALADIEGYNKTMDDLVVSNAKSLASAISSALSESLSGTGLETETINSLISGFSDLGDAADLSSVFYGTADGVKVDLVALQRLAQQQNQIINQGFDEKMNAISQAIEQASKAGDTTGLKNAQDELAKLQRQQSQYFATYEEQMKQFNRMSQIEFADQTDNAGKNYESGAAYLKSAKELYDKGLIGTDDFKARAAYFDPYGLTDEDTFLANYNRKSKYYTEDSTGFFKFMDDLVAKQLATYDEMDGYTLNFVDSTQAALQMGFGTEEFNDMLNRGVDCGATFQFVNSAEEAALKMSDLRTQLVDAQIEYARLKAQGADDTVLQKKNDEINLLQDNISNLEEATTEFGIESQNAFVEGFKNLPETIALLKEAYNDAEAAGDSIGMGKIMDEVQSMADKYGIKINLDDFTIDQASYDAVAREMGTNIGQRLRDQVSQELGQNLQAAAMGGASADALIAMEQECQATLQMIDTIIPELDKTDSKIHGIIDTIKSADTETLDQIIFGDGSVAEGAARELETALDGLISDLGLTQEQGNLLLQVLTQIAGMDVDVHASDEANSIEELNQKVKRGTSLLKGMQKAGQVNISFNMDQDPTQIADLSTLTQRRNELSAEQERLIKVGFSVDSSQYAALQSMIDKYDLQIEIQTVLQGADNVDAELTRLKEMTDEELAETFNIDVSTEEGQEKVEELKASLDSMTAAVTVRIADDQMQSLTANQEGGETTMKILGDNSDAKQKADEAEKYAKSKKPEMAILGDNTNAMAAANGAFNNINGRTATIKIEATGFNEIIQAVNLLVTQINHRTATIKVQEQKTGQAVGTFASGSVNIARTSGTAYNVLNYKPMSAYAGGRNVALGSDEDALTNELGQESVVFLCHTIW